MSRFLWLSTCVISLAASFALNAALNAAENTDAKNAQSIWTEDFQAALAESKKTGKPILIDFTGSDWCPPCKAQHKEVFGNEAWQKWAVENVILVTADFPKQKKSQEAAIRKQNGQLSKKYKPNGYPTIVFIDAEGTELGRWSGYGAGSGADKWIERAKPIVAKAAKSE